MRRIEELPEEPRSLAKRILCWVSNADPCLTVGALQHALALDIDDEEFDFDAISFRQSFIGYTAGLVTIEAEEVHLIHSTVREFFVGSSKDRSDRFPNAQPTIVNTCISYLRLKDFSDTCDSLPKRYEKYPFLYYATFNWASYAAKCWQALDEEIRNKCRAFVTRTPNGCLQVLASKVLSNPHPSRIPNLKYSALHVAVLCGAETILLDILHSNRSEVKATEHKRETPLHLAARSLSVHLVETLLAEGADVSAINYSGKTALDMVMLGPYEKVIHKMRHQEFDKSINMFLNTMKVQQKVSEVQADEKVAAGPPTDVIVEIAMGEARLDLRKMMEEWSTLHEHEQTREQTRITNRLETKLLAQSDLAMELSDEAAAIVGILVENKIDLVTHAVTGHSALQLAALYGREATVRQLLDHNANPFLEGGLGYTALQLANLRSHTKIEEMLSRRMEDLKAEEETLEPESRMSTTTSISLLSIRTDND